MTQSKKLRICLAASGGGHLSQLLKVSDCWKGYETFWVTTTDVVREKLSTDGRVYVIGECNRQQPIKVLVVFFRCLKFILQERPDVVISTGAAGGCMVCFLSKLLGAKIIWIDSITNVKKLSMSGRIVRYFADLFLVQWPELAGIYKNVEYVGALI